MKALRNWFDKQKPSFEKGGKYHRFKSGFGAIETFLFTPNHTNKQGTHVRDYTDLKRTMTVVILALVPALLFGMYNVGYQHFIATGQAAELWPSFWFRFPQGPSNADRIVCSWSGNRDCGCANARPRSE